MNLVRLREGDEVSDSPGDDVAAAVQVAVAFWFAPNTFAMSRATDGFSATTAVVPVGAGIGCLDKRVLQSRKTLL